MNQSAIHPTFTAFVEAVVLPRLLANPGADRLDGGGPEGNWEVAGYFRHDGAVWRAHEDNHFEPLLLAYYLQKFRPKRSAFVRAETPKGVRLDLVPEVQDLRPTKHRYMYLYLQEGH